MRLFVGFSVTFFTGKIIYMAHNTRGKFVNLFIGLAPLAGFGGGAWWLWSAPENSSAKDAAAIAARMFSGGEDGGGEESAEEKILHGPAPSGGPITPEMIATLVAPPPSHTETYRNERFGFQYNHTPQAIVTEYDEGGAVTIVHENHERVRGMQIFIVPYSEATISEERFLLDVPSGVIKNMEETTLDGVRAVTFNSYDARLGETREIWLIHHGHLFEITTFKGVSNWFTPIIQSWRLTN